MDAAAGRSGAFDMVNLAILLLLFVAVGRIIKIGGEVTYQNKAMVMRHHTDSSILGDRPSKGGGGRRKYDEDEDEATPAYDVQVLPASMIARRGTSVNWIGKEVVQQQGVQKTGARSFV